MTERRFGWMPRVTLSDSDFTTRHHAIRIILWVHITIDVMLLVAGGRGGISAGTSGRVMTGMKASPGDESGLVWGIIAAAIVCAVTSGTPRTGRAKSIVASLGLLLCADALVHAGGGATDLHFDFFVVVAVISLYQDWIPFAIAVGEVLLDHLVLSWLDPSMVFSSPAELAHPFMYSLLHGFFLLLMAAAQVAYWQFSQKAQEALAASEQESSRLALVAKYAGDSIVITRGDGVVEWVNSAFSELTGLPSVEVVGMPHAEVGQRMIPDTATRRRVNAGLLDHGESEFLSRSADGEMHWINLRNRPIVGDDGTVVRVISVARDVTQRRIAEDEAKAAHRQSAALSLALSEEKTLLGEVISAIPHLVYWKDSTGSYRGTNAAFDRLREEVGATPSEQDLESVLAPIEAEVRGTNRAVSERHVTVVDGSGAGHRFLVSVLPQQDADGLPCGLIGVGADVTRISELEQKVAQSNRLESIGQLAAGIAHEVNTPVQFVSDNTRFVAETVGQLLTLVKDLVAIAVADPDPNSNAAVVEMVAELDLEFVATEVPLALAQSIEGLERITQIVRALKDFSHPGQGLADADLNRAVESTVQISRNEWKYVAELELDLDPRIGLVPCYEGELKQVVLNLIVNAAQSIAESRSGGSSVQLGHITVATRADEGCVKIVVKDDGTGMSPEVQKRIFDPFFTTKDVGKGTGQGLSLAFATIVRHHGGQIGVESAEGHGATFTLILPHPAESSEEAATEGESTWAA